ncbi:ATP-binding protein [Argonema antarcticum]|uniref:ATP-binding protein n=1 Tax=Argonema antarcticum TaxID=2942763 RepID=UPI00201320AD|nr:ATP-binding protein [Argonema antarcticum]MCL1471240.1 response regulator [Argonema antarcticum A004/B2]
MSEVPLAVRLTTAPLPPNEVERLEALRRYNVLDTPPEESFDRITTLAARLFDVPIALVSLVDQFRAWFKSSYGFEGREVSREDTICSFAVLANDVFVVPDTRKDPRFACIPAALTEPGVRFYAGATLVTQDGFNLGTLCILDTKPHDDFSAEQRSTLADLAAMVVDELELRLASRQIIHLNAALQEVSQGVSAATGKAFFSSLVQHLTKALGVDNAFICELVDKDTETVKTIAVCLEGQIVDNFEYCLRNTLCSDVIKQRKICCYPREVQAQFPQANLLRKMEIESYIAVPLFSSTGMPLGLLGIMDAKPLANIQLAESLLTIFATRVAAELERQQLEAERAQLLAQEQAARAEAELQRTYLHSLLMEAPASIAIVNGSKAVELVYEFANPLYYQLVGKQELIGKSLGELFPELENQEIYEILDGVIATGIPFVGKEFPIKLNRRGNRPIDEWFFNFVYQPKYGLDGKIEGVMAFGFEVTDQVLSRQQAELLAEDLRHEQKALKESEERYRALVIATSQAVWTTNAEGLIIDDLPSWQSLTGQSASEVKGWGWLNAVHPEDRDCTAKCWTDAVETKSIYEIEHRLRTADGNYRYFFARGVPVFAEDGSIREWVGAHTDITLAKQIESERAQILAREQAARAEAEAANRIKDEFLAVLSHELRSPLNPILGWAKLLRTRQFDKVKTDQALETIERNAMLQTRLIEDLLDISRIMQGKISLNVCPVNLKFPIESALETVRLAAEAKSIDLRFSILREVGVLAVPVTMPTFAREDFGLEDAPENFVSIEYDEFSCNPKSQIQNPKFLVSGDASRLQQIVWNLVGNAIKFTPPGGCVEVELSLVDSPEFLTQNSYAQIQVRDTGKGINPEFLPHVFEYFRQADGSINRRHGGLGLGLAIARHLVEMHGGTIYAESEGEGKGATFTVQLPLMKVQAQTIEPRIPFDDALQLDGLRILVVDDEPDTLELHVFMLQQYGAQAIGATSAAEALQLLKRLNPDVLVSDLGMPNEDGYSLIRRVRALESPQGRAIPAIALTAYARAEDSTKALEAGFGRHISKPVEPVELVEAIANLIRIRNSQKLIT